MGMDVRGRRTIGPGYSFRDIQAGEGKTTVEVKGVGAVQQSSDGTAYFRSAGWAWGDLLEFALHAAPELADRLCIPWLDDDESMTPEEQFAPARQMFWGSNDGYGLREEDCVKMADAIMRMVRAGALKSSQNESFREHVLEWVRFLRACGGFRIF